MLHASNQNGHTFSQRECFSQVEPFEIKKKLISFLHFKIKLHNIKFNLNMKQKKIKSNNEIKYM
jgi:hypothetical protein